MKKILGIIGVYSVPFLALAQFSTGTVNPFLSILDKVGQILGAVVPIVITLALIYFIYGVAQYVTADDEEKKTKARDVMIYGAIGLFFIVSIWGIVVLLQQFTGTEALNTPPSIPQVPGMG